MIEKKTTIVVDSKWEITNPTGLEEDDYATVVQINKDVKSDEVKRIFPPLAPTVNEIHFIQPIHVEGEGKPNYFIYLKHEQTAGSESDTFKIKSDGTYRSLNPLLNPSVGDTVRVRQGKTEFEDEDKLSKETVVTIKE